MDARSLRAASLHQLQYLRKSGTGSLQDKLATAQAADARSASILSKLEGLKQGVAHSRAAARERDDRLVWRSEWDSLCASSSALERELEEWCAQRASWGLPEGGVGEGSESEEGGAGTALDAAPTLGALAQCCSALGAETQAWASGAGAAVRHARLSLVAAKRLGQGAPGRAQLLRSRVEPALEAAREACAEPPHWGRQQGSSLAAQLATLEAEHQGLLRQGSSKEQEVQRSSEQEGGEEEEEEEEERGEQEQEQEASEPAALAGAPAALDSFSAAALSLALEVGAAHDTETRQCIAAELRELHSRYRASRRAELRAWAAQCSAWGIEDAQDPLGGWSHSVHCAYLQLVAEPLKAADAALSAAATGSSMLAAGGGGGSAIATTTTTTTTTITTSTTSSAATSGIAIRALVAKSAGALEGAMVAGLRAQLQRLAPHSPCTTTGAPSSSAGVTPLLHTSLTFLLALLHHCAATLAPTLSATTAAAAAAAAAPPTPTMAQALAHHAWATARQPHRRRLAVLRAGYARAAAAAGRAGRERLAAGLAAAAAAAAAAEDRGAAAAAAAGSRARLESARARAALAAALAAVVQEEEAAAAAEAEGAAARARRAAAARAKGLLARYAAAQAEAERVVAAARGAAEAAQRVDERERLAEGRERVAGRERERAALAAQAAEQAAAQVAAAEAAREAALARVLASLPNRAALQAIAEQRDPERAMGHTATSASAATLSRALAAYLASLGGQGGGGDALVAAVPWGSVGTGSGKGEGTPQAAALAALARERVAEAGVFGARRGFTDKQVTGHTAFRLVSALRAEGLGGTKAVGAAFAGLGAPSGRGALQALKGNARSEG
jgi:hypothetical protein